MGMFEKIFGTYSEKEVKRLKPLTEKIESYSEGFKKLSDAQLREKTEEFKKRYKNGETLDELLPESFAVVREAADRVLGMRHYEVQLLGGIVLHQGRIAEMKTGEGKTLVATLPAYLNALSGDGVHIVTVNDYLATRDSEWMGKVYKFLGLSVGLIVHGLRDAERREAYASDITYGTNNEFGFDYLRDNMVIYKEQAVQRGHSFAIVDEVDSILIDEARTPLIISGAGDQSTKLYELADAFAKTLKLAKVKEADLKESDDDIDADYVDEKAKTVTLLKSGIKKAERAFGVENLADAENMTLSHHINQAIRAYGIMKKDVDYVVKDGQILIVDEFTGRLMPGRRYSDGLHQAIEAKERVKVQRESKTLATITFQNYFRLYTKLSGMTGTALTEENEFREIYKLDVIEIPTNKPMVRKDLPDNVYRTKNGKIKSVIEEIKTAYETHRPILVGTASIENSEEFSAALKKNGVPHQVLNAKFHEKEAQIISQAGKLGAVTIATNMAGRGTDIMLGGNAEFMAKAEMEKQGFTEEQISDATAYFETDSEEILNARKIYKELCKKYKAETDEEAKKVKELGGLLILGTERHEARRIDNQLRGRAGRQGDPGTTKFCISLEDDLMRLFGGEKMMGMIESMGLPEDEPIEHKMLSNAIEQAQKRIEARNFDTRKHVLLYDDVMNKQREIIYDQRRKVLDGENMQDAVWKMVEDTIDAAITRHIGAETVPDNWDFEGLKLEFGELFLKPEDLNYTVSDFDRLKKNTIKELLISRAKEKYAEKELEIGETNMRELERVILLQVVDSKWMNHIDDMDRLRQGITLRAYGQQDPVTEYKFEGYNMFEAMIESIKEDTTKYLFTVRIRNDSEIKRTSQASDIQASHGDDAGETRNEPVRKGEKIGRNDPCPCGSGKKYKKCCGR